MVKTTRDSSESVSSTFVFVTIFTNLPVSSSVPDHLRPVFSRMRALRAASQSLPPSWRSPSLARILYSMVLGSCSTMLTSRVPPPRSKTAIFWTSS